MILMNPVLNYLIQFVIGGGIIVGLSYLLLIITMSLILKFS